MKDHANLDLVARLRAGTNFYAESSVWFDFAFERTVDEAADEIERLRSCVKQLCENAHNLTSASDDLEGVRMARALGLWG